VLASSCAERSSFSRLPMPPSRRLVLYPNCPRAVSIAVRLTSTCRFCAITARYADAVATAICRRVSAVASFAIST
jgi:hypothetical protein